MHSSDHENNAYIMIWHTVMTSSLKRDITI